MKLNQYFDHTLLKPEATPAQIRALCEEAKAYEFYAVCVNGCYAALASRCLTGSPVKAAAVVGFPLGASASAVKAFETETACADGAAEIDMVINVGMLKAGNYDYVKEDIAAVTRAAAPYSAKVKVILETCLLTDEEIVTACKLSKEAGAHFVKTSTGFNSGGASISAVELMKNTVGTELQVKASGGIRTLDDALAMINAGADRIGASASCEIMEKFLRR